MKTSKALLWEKKVSLMEIKLIFKRDFALVIILKKMMVQATE